MKKLLTAIVIFCAFVAGAQAQEVYQRKYATETKLNFALWETDGTDLKVDATFAEGDCKVYINEADAANCGGESANLPTDEGSVYSLTITATEVTAARTVVCLVDQTSPKAFLDKCMVVETYGQSASAQHPDGAFATAQSGSTSTTIVLAAAENYADDLLNNNTSVVIVGGTGAGQVRCITDYDQSDDTATVAAWTTTPDNTSIYTLIETPNCNGTVGAIADGVTVPAVLSTRKD